MKKEKLIRHVERMDNVEGNFHDIVMSMMTEMKKTDLPKAKLTIEPGGEFDGFKIVIQIQAGTEK